MNKIKQVNPNDIQLRGIPYERDIKIQMKILQDQGQIEPILLDKDGKPSTGPHGWVYADAQIAAARKLCWETILVTDSIQ